jgi:hypothetical protein
MVKKKTAIHLGLEKILNDPNASPLTRPDVFRQVMAASNQPLTMSLRHIGKTSRMKKPSDDEKSKERLEKLEESQEK